MHASILLRMSSRLRPIPISSIPASRLQPLQPPTPSSQPSSSSAAPSPLSATLSSELPPNMRVQEWVEGDRKRWSGVSAEVRDGLREKKTRKFLRKGLRTMLRER